MMSLWWLVGICVGQNLDPPLTTVETIPMLGTNACAMLWDADPIASMRQRCR